MATTLRDGNLFKDLLMEAIPAAFAGRLALAGSGAAVIRDGLPTMMGAYKMGAGSKVQIPYFDSLGELEDLAEGDALTPRALTSTLEESTMLRSGIAADITNWAQIAAQAADPYKAVADQLARLALRRIDRGLITAAAATTLTYTEVAGGGTINIDSFTNARAAWGDEENDEDPIVLAVVHSVVMKKIRLLKDSAGNPLFKEFVEVDAGGNQMRRSTFMGIPLRMSDRVTPTGNVYPTLLCKRNSLVAWHNGFSEIESDRDILAASDIQAINLYHVEHMYKRANGGTKAGVVKLLTTEV